MNRRAPLGEHEIQAWLGSHPDWRVEGGHLVAQWPIGFVAGARAIQKIADVAEAMDHHPELRLRYGSLAVELWTHDRGAVTALDLELAERIDVVLASGT